MTRHFSNFAASPTLLRTRRRRHINAPAQGRSSVAVQQVVRYLRKMCPSRGEGGFVLSSRPPLVLCAGNKLSSGSNEARNCKLSREAQRRDKGAVFAGNVHEDESDMAQSHARMGVMIPPLLWRVMFNPFCLCIHLQIFLSPLICINTQRALFNTDLSDSLLPLVLTAISLLLLRFESSLECVADVEAFAWRACRLQFCLWYNEKKEIHHCLCV